MFASEFHQLGEVNFPRFTGIRVMMMPIVIGDRYSIPEMLDGYYSTIDRLFIFCKGDVFNKVGYLTIDEKEVLPGATHRRSGLHVDGGKDRGWGGGGYAFNGMITASSVEGCRAWNQMVDGEVGDEGSCDHLRDKLNGDGFVFTPNTAYWCSPYCVHESMPQAQAVKRQFIRLSMPSDCPWHEGYTENPLGVMPTGPIHPRRKYMDS